MPHIYCVRDGKRIPSSSKRIRKTSEPQVWAAIGYFGENVQWGKPICEDCRDGLRNKHAKILAGLNATVNDPQRRQTSEMQNNLQGDRTEAQPDVTSTGEQNPDMEYEESTEQREISLEQPSTSKQCGAVKRPKMAIPESEEYIAPEAQYSESNSDSTLHFESESMDHSASVNSREIKYYVEDMLSVAATERKCFICPEKSRTKIPIGAVDFVYIKLRIYIPPTNRCCPGHFESGLFNAEALKRIEQISRPGAMLSPKEFTDLLNRIADEADRNKIDFDSPLLTENDYDILTGLSKEQFNTVHDDYIVASKSLKNSKNRSTRNALAVFLAKIRLGVSGEFLGFLFGMDKRRISDTITSVTNALEEHFCPKYLGYRHIQREDVMAHTPDLVNGLYKVDDGSIVLILDGTYIYIQKSQDHQTQIETFSMHKHRNLVKAMMVVCSDGYILEAESLYKSNSKNNDASILQDMFDNGNGISVFVKKGDHFILDRGFRDVVSYLTEQGIIPHMPHFLDLKTKQKQFTPEQANESRMVTLIRWVVEAVNGRIKHKFKFFDKEVHNTYLQFGDPETKSCKLKSFFRIACALINAFSPPLSTNKPSHHMILDKVAERMNFNNELRNSILQKEINPSKSKWTIVESDSLMDFPILTEEDLFEITLGVYQINNAKFYAKRHLEEDPNFAVFFYKEDDNIIRAKIRSRFHNGENHVLWMKLDSTATGSAQIPYYYCKCKVGARDVGCCSHTTLLMWYLGYWRHLGQPINRMSFSSVLLDAGKKRVPQDVEDDDLDQFAC